jgi:hypothetical protein
MPIAFNDELGVRWTVAAHAAPRPNEPSNTTLVFTSESGERRTCDACLPPGATWDDVEERIWSALLRYSDTAPHESGVVEPGTPNAIPDTPAWPEPPSPPRSSNNLAS